MLINADIKKLLSYEIDKDFYDNLPVQSTYNFNEGTIKYEDN